MKTQLQFPSYLLIIATLLFATSCGTTRDPKTALRSTSAIVRDIVGTVEVQTSGREWRKARPGMRLMAGDSVRTAGNSEVIMALGAHGGVLTLVEHSTLLIERIGSGPSEPEVVTILSLTRGRLLGDTGNLKGGKILVRTLVGTVELK